MPPQADPGKDDEDPDGQDEQHEPPVPNTPEQEGRAFEAKARLLVLAMQAVNAGIQIAVTVGTVGHHLGWW